MVVLEWFTAFRTKRGEQQLRYYPGITKRFVKYFIQLFSYLKKEVKTFFELQSTKVFLYR